MINNKIIKGFLQGFKQLEQETGESLVSQTGKIAESVITAKELLGDIKPLSDEEMAQKQAEDEKKKQQEMSDVRSQISGRNVESEIKQISDQKKKEEEEKEKMFLENLKRQREQEEMERQRMMNSESMSSNRPKKDKGGNKHKTQQPDETEMSQTSEFKGKLN